LPDILQKKPFKSLDGTPLKKTYWSIVNDYDLKTAITELIDNAFDLWTTSGRNRELEIKLDADLESQTIVLTDNAGGVRADDLTMLVALGGSNNDPDAKTIGIFGVGSKRAVVAVAEYISIKTRFGTEGTYQIDITPDWLSSETWQVQAYEIPVIPDNTTSIEFSQLRAPLTSADEVELIDHLAATYQVFLRSGNCKIIVNNADVQFESYDAWAFPPDFSPARSTFEVSPDGIGSVLVQVTGGLIWDRDGAGENYGVYVFCNDRLVVKEWRSRDVGYFISNEAGVPHPDASLCRVIVEFAGPAKYMPWNTSKSAIGERHPCFLLAAPTIRRLCTQYSKLSRVFKNSWEDKVFPFTSGTIQDVEAEEVEAGQKLVLPPLPRVRRTAGESLVALNQRVIEGRHWIRVPLETISAVEVVLKQRLESRPKIALVLLDSVYEWAFKAYIAHNQSLFGNYDVYQLLKDQDEAVSAVQKLNELPVADINICRKYYNLRNSNFMRSETATVTDADASEYRDAVKRILTRLFYVIWV
jgi:hypothetical protein